jgi:hemerythrin
MKVIPQWTHRMSVRDPALDAQHIELLELCRTVQDMAQHGKQKSDLCAQRLEEIVYALRKHNQFEISRLLDRGERLSKQLRINRAKALQQLEELALAAPSNDIPQAKLQALLCGWIQYHLH